MTRSRPEAEQIGAVVERLAVLIAAGLTPQSAWRHVAESWGVRDSGSRESVTSRELGRQRGRAVAEVIRRVVGDIESGRAIADALGAAAQTAIRGERGTRGRGASFVIASSAGVGAGAGAGAGAVAGGRVRAGDDSGRKGSTRRGAEFTAGAAWAALAAAWLIASEAGAPLAACLDDIAQCLLAAGEVERDTAAALAGPLATTRMVIGLPLVSIVSGALLGLDTLHVLFASPAGIACLLSGGVLLLVARAWSRALLRRARRLEAVPGLALDLVAVAASGGGSLNRAVELVDEALDRFGVAAAHDRGAVIDVLRLAARAGAPPGELLRAEALRVRRDAVGLARRRAAGLDVWLMVPLGICVLPAFVLLSVIPVVVGVMSTISLS